MSVVHGRNFLMVPGPSNIPDRVQRAMHRNSVDHRSPDFPELTNAVLKDLKKAFVSEKGRPFIFPATGTGAWESALTNTLNPGDTIVSVRLGQFSHLWIDMMNRLGFDVIELDVEWGDGLPAGRIRRLLMNDKANKIKALCVVQNETTTGVFTDIPGMRNILDECNHPALLLVDGVSSIASVPFKMDEWGVDVAITGSQKGFMLPAGLGLLCASQKALKISETAKCPRVFFSWQDMIANNDVGYFPYTPSTPLLYGLQEALTMLLEEGIENVWERHHRLAEAVRRAVRAWGLKPCANNPSEYSDAITAVRVPPGYDGQEVVKVAYQKYNLSLGGGLMKVKGKVFRIGHLGDVNELTILGTLAGCEMAMRDVGIPIKLGSGVAAASDYLQKTGVPLRGLGGVAAKI
eukprot:Plantae.Rhodophyta-Purpureofilum_apyrenoidigerum.ctg3327.p2 GENE.Plantae.Rhodophyta-Purpureofilum_apyrenoidigerum.ctg3327~~Plantae.Rhodophyta-Purpureofilum_apyrenoidigerum.ctg3327.p2  ORF type:complete len:405 (+),score=62.69 Plantae.Rhodophyta-Purpureofilum_apyrenoidigerum.ctg3327:107-1321(+)